MSENKDMKPTVIYKHLYVGNAGTGMNKHHPALTGNDFAATIMKSCKIYIYHLHLNVCR